MSKNSPKMSIGSGKSTTEKKMRVWLVSILFSVGLLWTLPIPFGGSPDEPTYLEYGLFQTQAFTEDSVNESTYINITRSACFAFKIDIPANCQKFEKNSEVLHLSSTALINYPKPWFYLTSWPALILNGEIALIYTKFISFLLSFTMLLIPILYWKNGLNKLFISIAFGVTPLALSMIGAYNPNNFEIFSGVGIALMLFGQKFHESDFRISRGYLAWLLVMVCLASSAKPLSGMIIFSIFCLYGLFVFRNQKMHHKSILDNFRQRDMKIIGSFGLLSLPISVMFSWPSISQAKEIPVGQAEVNNLYALLNFLIRSYDYFIEHAGLFGWRDLPAAPWMSLLWLLLIFVILSKVNHKMMMTDKAILLVLWIVTIFIAPAVQSVLLAHQYNVGLQTRYLSGIFAAVSIYTVMMLVETSSRFAINTMKIWTLIAIVNGAWLFVRHSVGITPALTSGPNLIVDQIRNGVIWIPEAWFFILILLVITISLMGINFEKSNKTRFKGVR
jgi:hypothetical protein